MSVPTGESTTAFASLPAGSSAPVVPMLFFSVARIVVFALVTVAAVKRPGAVDTLSSVVTVARVSFHVLGRSR